MRGLRGELPGYLLAPSCQLEAPLTWKKARRRLQPGVFAEYVYLSSMFTEHLIEAAQIRFHDCHAIFKTCLSTLIEHNADENAHGWNYGGDSYNQHKLKICHLLFPFLRLAAADPIVARR